MNTKKWQWCIDIDTTTPALSRCMAALIHTRSKLLDTHTITTAGGKLGRGIAAFLLVEIPDGQHLRFAAMAKPYTMTRPPVLSVGMESSKIDAHPGDAWQISNGKVFE